MKILLGIQPTWRLHIWNYFWAIKKWLEMQDENNVEFLVANYHAWCDPERFDKSIDMMNRLSRLWVKNYKQQSVQTLELFYLLAHSTSVSELARLPQYATKEQSLHMLSYPLLMASDIIISNCDAVIVWDDQEPHMHFYREIARRNGYKEAITIKSDTSRIMSIKDPSKKMSKSLWDEHCIYLDDSLETLTEKIMKSPTTPEWIENLKMISKLFKYEYNENTNKESKEWLAMAISNFTY
jgi:tryptophanyl-tRNA synthetase